MNTAIASILAAAIILRLIVCILLFNSNDTTVNGDIISQALGPGTLRAIGAAILDPVHTWDHLEEACFWLDSRPLLANSLANGNVSNDVDYGTIYTPGTRVAVPPLVVALFGQTLVYPTSIFFRVIQLLVLTIADVIGACCIFFIGNRISQLENEGSEAEMERHTIQSEKKCTASDGTVNDDLIIPGILRPEMGWIFGLPSKSLLPDTIMGKPGARHDGEKQGDGDHIENDIGPATFTDTIISSTPLDRDPLILLHQLPVVASLCYFSNPISMLANVTGSLRSLWDALLLLSLYHATMPVTEPSKEGRQVKIPSATKVATFLALATYADAGYAMFLFPVLLWRGLSQSSPLIPKAKHNDWKSVLILYTVHLGGLHYFASLLVGGGSSAYKTVLVQTILPNVAFVQQDGSGSVPGPSMGLHW